MSDNKINKFDIIFFLTFSNYILIAYVLSPFFYDELGRNYYQVPIIMGLVSVIILLILPKENKVSLKKFLSNKLIRFVMIFFCLIEFLILLNASSYSLVYFYDDKFSWVLFYIAFFIVIVLLSINGFSNILKVGSVFFILALLLLFLPIISNTKAINFNFFKPIKIDFTLYNFYYLVIPFDFCRIYIINDICKENIKKSTLIKGFLIFNGFVLVDFLLTCLVFGGDFLKGYKYLGYISFRIQNTFDYLGQINIIYLFLIISITCFKGAYLFNIIRICLKIKMEKKAFISFSFLMFLITFLFIHFVKKILIYWVIVLIFFGIINYLYFIIQNRRISLCKEIS